MEKTTVFLSRRPDRDMPISKDDIINLKILLETCTSLEQFLERV
jgi:hypothetical protein